MDLVEQKPMNLIHGQHIFRVAGFNMVLSDEGATAFLQNGQGTTFALVIDRVVTHQLFEAHTAELLPAGDYKLVVKSRAGDAEGPLQTSFRRVKYLRVEDPAPHVPTAEWTGSLGTSGGELTVGGEAGAQLAALYEDDPSAAYARVKFTDPDGEEITCPMQATDGKLVVSASVSASCQAGDAYTLAVQVEDSAGTLVTILHEYTVTEVYRPNQAGAATPRPPLFFRFFKERRRF